jgi:hypothetical protein
MKNYIAFCGIDCSECPAFIATQKKDSEELEKVAKMWSNDSMLFKPEDIFCDGCTSEGRHFSWCSECEIKLCCSKKGIKNCAYCEDYICETLRKNFEKTPLAKERLDKIKNKL